MSWSAKACSTVCPRRLAVAGNHHIRVRHLVEQESELEWQSEREASGAIHWRPGGLHDVADQPSMGIRNVHDEVGIGMPRAERYQVDSPVADVKEQGDAGGDAGEVGEGGDRVGLERPRGVGQVRPPWQPGLGSPLDEGGEGEPERGGDGQGEHSFGDVGGTLGSGCSRVLCSGGGDGGEHAAGGEDQLVAGVELAAGEREPAAHPAGGGAAGDPVPGLR